MATASPVGSRSGALRAAPGSAYAWVRRRPTAAAALIYLVVAALFVGPALLPGKTLSNSDALWFEPPWVGVKPSELERPSNAELGDAPRHLQLFLREAAQQFPDVALWNPSIVAGRPFHANAQSAIFGPYTLPAYVLPFWTALGWIGVLKLWVAAFGTFLLARALGMRFGGALLAGVVFALNLRLVTWLSYPAMSVWTFIPWLLFLTDRLVRRPDLLTGAGLAAAVALQFLAGHPESSFHALLATLAFFALRLWQARRGQPSGAPPLARPVLAFAAGLGGGTALAAVTLVPFGELLWLSADLTDRAQESVDVHLPVKDALGIFLPDYWGRPTQTPIRPFLLDRALYAGALPLMLAAAALIVRPTATRVAVALFGGLWLAVALGVPPFLQVITRLPIFSSGHNTRLVVITMLAVALLAGWGLDELTTARRIAPARRRRVLAAAVTLFVAPLVVLLAIPAASLGAVADALGVAWLFADSPTRIQNPGHEAVIPLSSLVLWLTLAGAGAGLLALRLRGRLRPGPFAAVALVLVCVDLFRAGMGYNPAIDRERAAVPPTGAVRTLQGESQGLARFVSTSEIPQNVIPMRFGLQEARGYDLPIIRRFDRLWRREVDPASRTVAAGLLDIPLELREVTPRALRALRLLGVTHILHGTTGRAATPPFEPTAPYPPLRAAGLTEVYGGGDARVYRLEGSLPRAWVVGAQHPVDGDEAALDAITRAGFEARRVAVTERRVPGLPTEARLAGRPPAGGDARIVRYEPERVVVRSRTTRPALVVLADTQFPGWRAEVDGEEVPVERVDYVFRGVPVGPGVHTVELRYEALSWRIGWIVSVVSFAGLLVVVIVGLRRRRAPDAPVTSPRAVEVRHGAPTRV